MKRIFQFAKMNRLLPYLFTEDTRREYLTRVILAMASICMGFFAVTQTIGFLLGIIDISMTYLFPILVASIISWILAKKGYWRIVNIVPACLSFLLGLYGSLNYGLYTTLVVFYPLSFILNGILIGNRAMVITILLSLVVHLLSALYISNIPWLVVLPSIASMTGAFVGIASLQWLSFALLNQALMHGIHDPLTGLYNRAFYDAEIERFSHTRRYPVSVLMCDLNG